MTTDYVTSLHSVCTNHVRGYQSRRKKRQILVCSLKRVVSQDGSGYLDRKELDSFIRDLIQQKSGVSRSPCVVSAVT